MFSAAKYIIKPKDIKMFSVVLTVKHKHFASAASDLSPFFL